MASVRIPLIRLTTGNVQRAQCTLILVIITQYNTMQSTKKQY